MAGLPLPAPKMIGEILEKNGKKTSVSLRGKPDSIGIVHKVFSEKASATTRLRQKCVKNTPTWVLFNGKRATFQNASEIRQKCHWEIKGRFRKRVVLASVPSFRFSFWGNIRRNHPFGNHPFVNTKKGYWEIKGRFPKEWFWRTYPRSGFRSGGTSAKTTLLETTLLRTPENASQPLPCRITMHCNMVTDRQTIESQTSVSKRVPREFRYWRVQGNPLTLCQPFANPSPTLGQPCLPTPLQPPLSVDPGTGLETWDSGLLDKLGGRLGFFFFLRGEGEGGVPGGSSKILV